MKSYQKLKAELLKDGSIRRAYEETGPEFAIIERLIEKRLQRHLTQAELAKKIGTHQAAISRFEAGGYNPTLGFLQKVAKALDAELKVTIS